MYENKEKTEYKPEVACSEKRDVTQFIFEQTVPAGGRVKTPISDVFKSYQSWRKAHELSKSKLTVDGFGRLFPHTYARGSAHCKALGHSCKQVFGLRLVA